LTLVSLPEACARLGLTDAELFWLMSVKRLPAWLLGGVWKFEPAEVDAWAATQGGVEAVQVFVRAARERHREAARVKSDVNTGAGGG
jgi:predicted DNA-binding transcriptional regulator AlpA